MIITNDKCNIRHLAGKRTVRRTLTVALSLVKFWRSLLSIPHFHNRTKSMVRKKVLRFAVDRLTYLQVTIVYVSIAVSIYDDVKNTAYQHGKRYDAEHDDIERVHGAT